MPIYPARLIPSDEGVTVRFPDVPEAVALGASEEEALANARGILASALATYRSEGRPLPDASDICGAPTVEADPEAWRATFFPDGA